MSALRNVAIDWYRKVFGAPAGSDIRDEGLDCVLDGNAAIALTEAGIATHAVLGGSDCVTTIEAPTNAVRARISMERGARGTIKVTTLPAMTVSTFVDMLQGKSPGGD